MAETCSREIVLAKWQVALLQTRGVFAKIWTLAASAVLKLPFLVCRYNTVSAHYKENECMRQM